MFLKQILISNSIGVFEVIFKFFLHILLKY